MDTNIECLVETISDSIKRKNEEIANLKLELKNSESTLEIYKKKIEKLEKENEEILRRAIFFSEDKKDPVKKDDEIASLETDLEICENRIKELEEENKKLQEENRKKLEELVESDNTRIKNAYKDGYGTAVFKMSACLQEMKFDAAITIEQDLVGLKKALLIDYGNCCFKVFDFAATNNKLNIIKALKDIYNAPLVEIKKYVSSLPINGFGNTILLNHVSEATCRKLKSVLDKIQIKCDYCYI